MHIIQKHALTALILGVAYTQSGNDSAVRNLVDDYMNGNLKVSLQTFFPACMTLQPLYIRLIRASMAGNATLSARVMQPLSMASSALEQPSY